MVKIEMKSWKTVLLNRVNKTCSIFDILLENFANSFFWSRYVYKSRLAEDKLVFVRQREKVISKGVSSHAGDSLI